MTAAMLLAWGCGDSKPAGQCDQDHGCDGGRVCVTGGICAAGCSTQGGDAGCADGAVCTASGPYCDPGGACPAIAVEVCLAPDGGAP